MFEAHFNTIEDFQSLEQPAHSWTKTYYRRHELGFQTLRIWFARGQRRTKGIGIERKIFVYIEYQDKQKNNRYCCLEVVDGLSVVEVLDLATKANLSLGGVD